MRARERAESSTAEESVEASIPDTFAFGSERSDHVETNNNKNPLPRQQHFRFDVDESDSAQYSGQRRVRH